jgi:hypothetical protein
VQNRKIKVDYTPTRSILTDGLIKALSKDKFNEFCQQIGLIDITNQLQLREQLELPEIQEEDLEIENFQFNQSA